MALFLLGVFVGWIVLFAVAFAVDAADKRSAEKKQLRFEASEDALVEYEDFDDDGGDWWKTEEGWRRHFGS